MEELISNSYVSMKVVCGRDRYSLWKIQVMCLLKSYGTFGLWKRSDALVKGWIRGSFSEHVLEYVVDLQKQGFKDSLSRCRYFTTPVFEATRQNAYEVIEHILSTNPNVTWIVNDEDHSIIEYSIIHRSEKIYNLLYQMSEHENIYKTIKDSSGNNLLHLAARLAPSNKLNRAALQIQHELQWFKEVEGFVRPLKTPRIW